jgi:DNA-binding CsgD family transcriptional regulator
MDHDELRLALAAIEPRGRELLRRYLIADQVDRDASRVGSSVRLDRRRWQAGGHKVGSDGVSHGGPAAMSGASGQPQLTLEERDLLRLLAAGASQRTISDRLGISNAAVESEIKVILDKLGVHSRLEAVARQVSSDALRDDLRRLSRRSRDLLLRWLVAALESRDEPASQALKRRAERTMP